MSEITKYIPVCHVTVNGVTYLPCTPGGTQKTIEGLTDKEITRLLKMKAIKAIAFEDGQPGEKSIEKMNYTELKAYATSIDLVFPGNILKTDLLDMIKKTETSDDSKEDLPDGDTDDDEGDDTVRE